jgi:hypothetical protein
VTPRAAQQRWGPGPRVLGPAGLLGLILVVGGCRKPVAMHFEPAQVQPEELRHVLSELPAPFRQDLAGTDEERARDLGLRVWALEYSGGPILCWLSVEETGQRTFALSNFPDSARTSYQGSDAESGRILLWLQPRASREMNPQVKQRLGRNEPQVPNLVLGFDIAGAPKIRASDFGSGPVVPLWFGWDEAALNEVSRPLTLTSGGEATMLLVEATEGKPREGVPPRTVKLALKVKPKPP